MREREVAYEVWRTHNVERAAPDIRVQGGLAEGVARHLLKTCNDDKSANYPDAPLSFYMARATTTREKIA